MAANPQTNQANSLSVLQTAAHPHLAPNQSPTKPKEHSENDSQHFELIDAPELAARWHLPASWIREQTRSRSTDPIPHLRLGRYVRFQWGSPELTAWIAKRRHRRS